MQKFFTRYFKRFSECYLSLRKSELAHFGFWLVGLKFNPKANILFVGVQKRVREVGENEHGS